MITLQLNIEKTILFVWDGMVVTNKVPDRFMDWTDEDIQLLMELFLRKPEIECLNNGGIVFTDNNDEYGFPLKKQ